MLLEPIKLGGTDVVNLPDVLLPEGQYSDMFDSESDFYGDLSDEELVKNSPDGSMVRSFYVGGLESIVSWIHPMVCLFDLAALV